MPWHSLHLLAHQGVHASLTHTHRVQTVWTETGTKPNASPPEEPARHQSAHQIPQSNGPSQPRSAAPGSEEKEGSGALPFPEQLGDRRPMSSSKHRNRPVLPGRLSPHVPFAEDHRRQCATKNKPPRPKLPGKEQPARPTMSGPGSSLLSCLGNERNLCTKTTSVLESWLLS